MKVMRERPRFLSHRSVSKAEPKGQTSLLFLPFLEKEQECFDCKENSDSFRKRRWEKTVGFVSLLSHKKLLKRTWRMPWHKTPMKDVVGCDKPRGVAYRRYNRGCPNGETSLELYLVALIWIHRISSGNWGNWNILVPWGRESKQRLP